MKRLEHIPPTCKSISLDEALAKWKQEQHQHNGGICFNLQTMGGTLSYSPNEENNYTEFLRVIMEMMLAFNSGEIDPFFKKLMKQFFKAYDSGDDNLNENDDEFDFLQDALQAAEEEKQKIKEVEIYIESLPKIDKLNLQILQFDQDEISTLDKILSQYTDLPPIEIHKTIHDKKVFTVIFEKAVELYSKLRLMGVILSIKPPQNSSHKSTLTTSKKSVSRSAKIKNLTGNEKLPINIGVIR